MIYTSLATVFTFSEDKTCNPNKHLAEIYFSGLGKCIRTQDGITNSVQNKMQGTQRINCWRPEQLKGAEVNVFWLWSYDDKCPSSCILV